MRIDLAPLWRTLEGQPDLKTTKSQWLTWLGRDAFEVVRGFLRVEAEPAEMLPCDWRPRQCIRRVKHLPSGVQAICEDVAPGCRPVALTHAELIVYSLRVDQLAAHLGTLFCLEDSRGTQVRDSQAWAMGRFSKTGLPPTFIYLVLPEVDSSVTYDLHGLLALSRGGPVGLVIPSERPPDEVARLVHQQNAQLWTCSELFDTDDSAQLVARRRPFGRRRTDPLWLGKDDPTPADVSHGVRRPIALQFTHGAAVPALVSNLTQLAELRAANGDYDHFVDALHGRAVSSRRTQGGREAAELTEAELSMLVAFLARRAAGLDYERPENIRVPNVSTPESRKQIFKEMRRKVDRNTSSRIEYALFKSKRSLVGGAQLYTLQPDDQATYCILIRPSDYDLVLQQISAQSGG